jgi:hypothetical protein
VDTVRADANASAVGDLSWLMANKTQPTTSSVSEFIDSVPNERRRDDSRIALAMMQDVSGLEPVMWGPTMVGFGSVHYKYESGREGDMPLLAFAPRKDALTLYLLIKDDEEQRQLLERLGPHSTGKICLYIKDLSKVDLSVLRALVERAAAAAY